MGSPNTGEIYEGALRSEGDVPLNQDQAEWLRSLPVRDRIAELKEMQEKLRHGEKPPDSPTAEAEPRPSVLFQVGAELAKARATHAPMNGHHEGYAVILEELDELWDICKRNTHSRSKDPADAPKDSR